MQINQKLVHRDSNDDIKDTEIVIIWSFSKGKAFCSKNNFITDLIYPKWGCLQGYYNV